MTEFLVRVLEKISSSSKERAIRKLQRYFASDDGQEFLSKAAQRYGIDLDRFKEAAVGQDEILSWPEGYRLILRLEENEFARAIDTGKPEEIHYTFRNNYGSNEESANLIIDIEKKIEIVTSAEIFHYGRGLFETSGIGTNYKDKTPGRENGLYTKIE